MFTSTRISESPLYKKRNQKLSETNGISKSIMSPILTSTTLHSMSMNNRRSSLLSSPRNRRLSSPDTYVTPPKYMNSIDPNVSKYVQNPSGPLLASTQYNINLSTYVDSKSPGYASRVVQYNEERERSLPTHQARYGSPGMFPVVHLFKKDLPVISPKPRRVTVRIAPSDSSRYNTPEHNKLLLEDMMQEGNRSNHQNNDISTRSVLDALKEISRKRIHPGEEYDINEDTVKRLRSDCFNGGSGDTYKRPREDSPKAEGTSQSNKKICFIDPFYASATSTVLEKERLQKLLSVPSDKTTRSVQVEEPEEREEEVKLVSVETQTLPEETPVLSKPKDDSKKIANKEDAKLDKEGDLESDTPLRKERKAPLRIFDEKPLEIMRKNRLAVLLGALTGEKPVLIPKEDKLAKLREEMEKEEEAEKNVDQKQPKSILSSGHKPNATEKHVTFSSSTFTSYNDTNSNSTAAPATPQNPAKFSPSITQTSTSIVTPVMSASVCDSPKSPGGSDNKLALPQNTSATSPFQSPSGFSFGSNNETSKQPDKVALSQFSNTTGEMNFGTSPNETKSTGEPSSLVQNQPSLTPTSTSSAQSPGFTAFKFDATPPNTTATSDFGAFKFGGSPKTASPSSSMTHLPGGGILSTGSSETKTGGFKFDLSKPSVSASSTPSNLNSSTEKPETTKSFFGTQPSSSASGTSNNMFGQSTQVSTSASKGGFSFTAAPNSDNTNPTNNSFASPGSLSLFNKEAAKPSPFGSATAVTNASSAFKFGSAAQETKSALNETSVTNPVLSSSAPTFAFGQANANNSGTNVVTSVSTGFGTSATTLTFGSSNAADKSGSQVPTTSNSIPSFGSAPASVTSGFGGSANTPAFGTNVTSTSGFGTLTNTPAFGSNTNLAFGSTPNNSISFGSNPATTTTSGFGSSTSTAAPVFGGTAPTQPSPFGSVSTSNTSGFGSNNTPSSMFNASATTSSTSASNTAPVFGNAGFANKSAGFSFGGSNPATTSVATNAFGTSTTASSMFGTTSKPQFSLGGGNNNPPTFSGTASPFGSTTQAAPAFGTATPSFGAPTTTAPAFGAPNTTLAFGSTTSPFATTTTSTSSTPAFGATTNAPGSIFGGSTAPAFGNTAKPLFGSGATGFGNNPTTTTNSSMFGNNSAPSFAFGATTTTTSSGFGQNNAPAFGTTTTASSSFGSSSTPAFGSTSTFGPSDSTFKPRGSSFSATPAFGAASTSSSGPATTSAPSFGLSSGFGSGGSSFGSNSSGGFGTASSTPAFGSTAPTSNSFAATSNNMFGSGFGSGAASAFDSKQQTNLGASTTNAFSGTTNTFGGSGTNTGFGSNLQNPPAFPSSSSTQNGVFTFGSSNNTQQPSVGFSFGSSEPPKPTFNFTSGSNATPNFGASPAPAFGTNPSPAFGANPNGQFPGAPAMFSIGSGTTSSNRARTQLKARRRTER